MGTSTFSAKYFIKDKNHCKFTKKLNTEWKATGKIEQPIMTTTATMTPSTDSQLDISLLTTWQWEEWAIHSDGCNREFKKRVRICYDGQKCLGTSYEVDIDNFYEDDFIGLMLKIIF